MFPSRGGAFITTDVHIFGGENLHQLIENVFHEAHCLRIRHVQHIGEHPTPRFHAVHSIGIARKLGISRHRCGEVTRHIDFGNDLNVFRSRIRHDFFQIFTSVEIGTILLVCPVSTMLHRRHIGVGSHRTHLREFGIFLHFPTPSLVFGQVEMELIELVNRHHIEHLLHLLHTEEVARHIEHKTAVRESGFVGDLHQRQFVSDNLFILHSSSNAGWQHLLQTGQTIEETAGSGTFQADAISSHRKFVALLSESFVEGLIVHQLERRTFSLLVEKSRSTSG